MTWVTVEGKDWQNNYKITQNSKKQWFQGSSNQFKANNKPKRVHSRKNCPTQVGTVRAYVFSPRIALCGCSSALPGWDSVSSDMLTGAKQAQCLGRDPKSQRVGRVTEDIQKSLHLCWLENVVWLGGCQTWELARNLTRRFWKSENREGLNEDVMEAWVTRGTYPQENGELGVRVHVCVHVCVHLRARTHTHRKTAETLTSMPSLASTHRDPSTDGEMSRLNQADMEQTLKVRLENKNQNYKVS